jgi:hypothetical protein
VRFKTSWRYPFPLFIKDKRRRVRREDMTEMKATSKHNDHPTYSKVLNIYGGVDPTSRYSKSLLTRQDRSSLRMASWLAITFLVFFAICQCQKSAPSQPLAERFQRILKIAQKSVHIPSSFVPIHGSESHRKDVKTAVFSVGMILDLDAKYFQLFLGTLRKTGFDGDVVIAIDPTTNKSNTELCFKWGPVVYKPDLDCKLPHETKWKPQDRECRIVGTSDPKVSLNMMRYRLYQWWASQYEKDTNILIADFRDVFFQSNPFLYMPSQWAQPVSQLTVFLEAVPLKAIYRCPFNAGWIRWCYGKEAMDSVKMNPVSCSGTSLGSRDGILVYVSRIPFSSLSGPHASHRHSSCWIKSLNILELAMVCLGSLSLLIVNVIPLEWIKASTIGFSTQVA